MFGLEMQGNESSLAESEARQWLEMVGLSRFEDSYPDELSGGMKPRVVMARARPVRQFLLPEFLALKARLDDLIDTPSGDDEEEVEKLPVIKMTDAGDDVE